MLGKTFISDITTLFKATNETYIPLNCPLNFKLSRNSFFFIIIPYFLKETQDINFRVPKEISTIYIYKCVRERESVCIP